MFVSREEDLRNKLGPALHLTAEKVPFMLF